jgi:copper ion binding protein
MSEITLKIKDMACSGCAANIERVLKRVDGVSNAAVNLNAKEAVVEYDPDKTSEQNLAAAIKDAGYTVG